MRCGKRRLMVLRRHHGRKIGTTATVAASGGHGLTLAVLVADLTAGVTEIFHDVKGVFKMDEAELNALVESKLADRLAARLKADREAVWMEVVSELRREASRKHYDRINAKHPVEDRYGGLGPEGHAARLRAMDERAKAANEHMDRVNARPVPGGLLDQRSRAALTPGSEGLEIRPGRRS
jgi:hypothetical protein